MENLHCSKNWHGWYFVWNETDIERDGGGERKREREGVRVNIMYFRLIRMPCEKRFSATAIVYSLYYYYDIILVRFSPHFCLFYSLTHHLSSFVDASSIHHDFEIKHSTSMMRKMESSMSKHIGLCVCVCKFTIHEYYELILIQFYSSFTINAYNLK